MSEELKTEFEIPAPREHQKMTGSYHCPELTNAAVRIGADDHMKHPSRRGKYLVYKDGRKELV